MLCVLGLVHVILLLSSSVPEAMAVAKNTTAILQRLRTVMKSHVPDTIQAYIVTSQDAHTVSIIRKFHEF